MLFRNACRYCCDSLSLGLVARDCIKSKVSGNSFTKILTKFSLGSSTIVAAPAKPSSYLAVVPAIFLTLFAVWGASFVAKPFSIASSILVRKGEPFIPFWAKLIPFTTPVPGIRNDPTCPATYSILPPMSSG